MDPSRGLLNYLPRVYKIIANTRLLLDILCSFANLIERPDKFHENSLGHLKWEPLLRIVESEVVLSRLAPRAYRGRADCSPWATCGS